MNVPHAPPFRFFDRVLERTPGRAVVIKCVTAGEVLWRGGDPAAAFPSALLAEALAQAALPLGDEAGASAPDGCGSASPRPILAAIEEMRTVRAVRPGDRLRIVAEVIGSLGSLLRVRSRAEIDGAGGDDAGLVAEATVVLTLAAGAAGGRDGASGGGR